MFLRIYLLSAVIATGASLTTCRIWEQGRDGAPDIDLAVDVGATSCFASVGRSQADAQFETGGVRFLDAYVHNSFVNQDGTPRGVAKSVGDASDILTFYGLPAGSIFILEWALHVNRVDSDANIELLGLPIPFPSTDMQGNNFLPIINSTVEISGSISATTSWVGFGHWTMAFGIDLAGKKFSRVVDADGNPITGFTYSVASERRYYIPDGTQVQSVPEPSTWALLVVPFLWLAVWRRNVKKASARTA